MQCCVHGACFVYCCVTSALLIHQSIRPKYLFLTSVAYDGALFSSMHFSVVHSSQHDWLMFDTESQLFLTHGQWCGLNSNDAGSLESGPGNRLEDCGFRQEALLEHGLGGEGHPQSAQRCIFADQGEVLQDHGDSIQIHQGNERERQVACGDPAGYYDGFRGHVIEVLDQSSPATRGLPRSFKGVRSLTKWLMIVINNFLLLYRGFAPT